MAHTFRLAALVLLALTAAGQAVAQDQIRAKAGEETRIAALGSLRSKADCSVNPAPAVSIVEPARHGTIRIVKGRLRTNRFPECPDAEIPVTVVFYKSQPEFKGSDQITLSIQFPEQVSSKTVSVLVE